MTTQTSTIGMYSKQTLNSSYHRFTFNKTLLAFHDKMKETKNEF